MNQRGPPAAVAVVARTASVSRGERGGRGGRHDGRRDRRPAFAGVASVTPDPASAPLAPGASPVAALGSSVMAMTRASASVAAAHDGASIRRWNLRPSGSSTVSSATTTPRGATSMRARQHGHARPVVTNRMRLERAATRAISSSRVEQAGQRLDVQARGHGGGPAGAAVAAGAAAAAARPAAADSSNAATRKRTRSERNRVRC